MLGKACFLIGTSLVLSVVMILLPRTALPKCIRVPEVLAKVEIKNCQPAKFKASSSLHKKGARIEGVLLTVVVQQSAEVWRDKPLPQYERPSGIWTSGERKKLFLEGEAASVCPTVVFKALHVVTEDVCCDAFPLEEFCLVPNEIPVVTVEPHPELWHKY